MNFLEQEKRVTEENGTRGIFFVTLALQGALASDAMRSLKEELERETRRLQGLEHSDCRIRRLKKVYFTKIDAILDATEYGPQWLRKYDVAKLAIGAMEDLDGKTIKLLCYTVMPNHVHLVFEPLDPGKDRQKAIEALDEFEQITAEKAAGILDIDGEFWIGDDHLHPVHDSNELINIISYILENPVKAGLVDYWRDWPWSYCNADYI